MNFDRKLNAKRNVIWGAVNKIVSILGPFLIRTVIIKELGAEYLGLNGLFTSILQVLSLSELGIGSAMVFSMYKPIAEDDDELMCALLNLYRKIYRIIGMVILGLGLIILPFIKVFIKDSYPSHINLYILFIIYVINTSISYFLYAYKQSILQASQRNDIDNNIVTLGNLIMYTAQIIILIRFKNYYIYSVILPIATVLINFARSYKVDKMFPQYTCRGTLDSDIKKDLNKRVIGLMMYKVSYVFRTSFDSIIISSFLGLVVLAKYQNYYYIVNSLTGVLSIFTNSITASIGNSVVTESIEKNHNDLKKFLFIINWMSAVCSICLLCLFQDFIKLWVGEEYCFNILFVAIIVVYFYCLQIGNVSAIYREAIGLWWHDKFRPVIESLTNLILNILLVNNFGVYGVMVSTIFSIVVINIPWAAYILFKYYFEMSCKEYLADILKYFITLVVISGIAYIILNKFAANDIVFFIIKGILAVCISNILLFIKYRNRKEFKESLRLLRSVIRV